MPELFARKPKTAEPVIVDHVAETKSFTPGIASVNIIPGSLLEEYKVNDVRKKFIASGIALVTALLGIYGAGTILQKGTDSNIEATTAQITQVQNDASQLSGYQTYFKLVDQKRAALSGVMTNDTKVGDIIDSIQNAATASGVSLSSISISIAGSDAAATGAASACPSPDPFKSTATAGCITFEGTASDRQGIDTFVSNLSGVPGFVDAYIPSSTTSGGEEGSQPSANVSGSVGFTVEFYSQKYSGLSIPLATALTGEQTTDETASSDTSNGETPVDDVTATDGE